MNKKSDLSTLTKENLLEQASQLKKELMIVRFKKFSGEFKNTSRFSKIRKDVARINTELTKRNLEANNA